MGVNGTRDSHEMRVQLLARALDQRAPPRGAPFACPYLRGRAARHQTVLPQPLAPGTYHALMDLNFRRLGPVFYRPRCDGCTECRALRVLVGEFEPSRSQRRCQIKNRDLRVEVGSPEPSDEKHALYARYLEGRHDGQMDTSPEAFREFLHTSNLTTLEATYRCDGRLLGVGLADLEPEAMSAVYCYFDPDTPERGLGVFNVLWLVEECRRRGLPYLYLGYLVRECPRMSYKARYRPCEVLGPRGWERLA
jgi:arginine-tRNA-protein transferase